LPAKLVTNRIAVEEVNADGCRILSNANSLRVFSSAD